jgi:hypothetical protein
MAYKPHTLKEVCCVRKPNRPACSRFFSDECLRSPFRISFFNNLPVMERRIIGHKHTGILGSYQVLVRIYLLPSNETC